MRFRKRVKVFPGFYLNFSSSGISSTIGVKGASINFSRRGTYLNTSIPGTGFYNRQKIGGSSVYNSGSQTVTEPEFIHVSPMPLVGEIKSAELDQLTSTSFKELQDTLLEVYTDRMQLQEEIKTTKVRILFARILNVIACLFLVGFFIKTFKKKIADSEDYLSDLEQQLENSVVDIDIHFDKNFNKVYNVLIDKYKELLTSKIIWDITSSVNIDRRITRSSASHAITRVPVKFSLDNISIIRSSYPALHFENKNGGDLYIYPAFVIITTNQKEFALVDIKDFKIDFSQQRFIEEEKIPSDTRTIDMTWAKVNKNGTPDKRFKDNYEIPIVRYGKLEITSHTGLNEAYSVSNYENAAGFSEAFTNYQKLV